MFKSSKSPRTLNACRGKLLVASVEQFLFGYNHDRFRRSDFTAPGNWDIFMNIINVEAHLVTTLFGLEPTMDPLDNDFQDYRWFLISNALLSLLITSYSPKNPKPDRARLPAQPDFSIFRHERCLLPALMVGECPPKHY